MKERLSSFENVIEDDYKIGQQYLTKCEYLDALRAFTQDLKNNPTHKESIEGKVIALVALGEKMLENKDWAMAEIYWKEAHQLALERRDFIEKLAFARHQKYLIKKNTQTISMQIKSPVSPPRIDNLIFQGGGIKGLAYLGALDALYANIDMSQIKRFGGTSAGAINALVLGLGYSQEELQALLKEIDFAKVLMDGDFKDKVLNLNKRAEEIKVKSTDVAHKFKQASNPLFGMSVLSVVLPKISVDPDFETIKESLKLLTQQNFGLFPGDIFREDWVEAVIQTKSGIAYATFKELHDFGFKPIYFVGANISTGRAEVFSHETTPDAIVSDALRISMSIPLFFKPHQLYIKQNDQRILHPSQAWYVDGGIIDNYPIWLFDKAGYWQESSLLPQAIARNPYTLGLRLTTAEHKAIYEGKIEEKVFTAPTDLGAYLWSIVQTVYGKQNSDHVKLQEQDRSIYIDYLGIKTTQFDLNEKDQEALIKSGYEAVKAYFHDRYGNGEEKSLLDKAIEENCKSAVLSLIANGIYACKNPEKVQFLLKEAAKCEWLDAKQILDNLKYFEVYHHGTLQPENPNSLSTSKFF